MLRGKDVQEIEELKRQGLSIRAISRLTGYDRKTIRKYLIQPEAVPEYGPRPAPPCTPMTPRECKSCIWKCRTCERTTPRRY